MPKVEVLCGMIASGKSTYAKMRAKEGAVVINDDAIVLAVHGGDYSLYEKDLKPLYKGMGNYMMAMGLAYGRDVVVDRTGLSRRQRITYLHLAHQMDVRAQLVVFPMAAPSTHARRRFEADSRGYTYQQWLEVAQRHAGDYDWRFHEEGWDSITSISEGDLVRYSIKKQSAPVSHTPPPEEEAGLLVAGDAVGGGEGGEERSESLAVGLAARSEALWPSKGPATLGRP